MSDSGNNPALNHYTIVLSTTLSTSSGLFFFFLFYLFTHCLIIWYFLVTLSSSFRNDLEVRHHFFKKLLGEEICGPPRIPERTGLSFFSHNNTVLWRKCQEVIKQLLFLIVVVTTPRCPTLSRALVTYIFRTSGKIQ